MNNLNIIVRKNLLCYLILLLQLNELIAQIPSPNCILQQQFGPVVPVFPPNCSTPTSTAYMTKYRLQNTYIPTTNDPVITVKLTVHIFTDNNGNGIWTQSDIPYLQQIFATLTNGQSDRYSVPRYADYLTPGFVPNQLTDSRIQYELTNIYFYPSTPHYGLLNDFALFSHINSIDPQRLEEGLPIVINNDGYFGHMVYGGLMLPSGRKGVKTSFGAGAGTNVLNSHFRHEIGHCFELYHTYGGGGGSEQSDQGKICSPLHIDFLEDVFPQNNPHCAPPFPPAFQPCGVCEEKIISQTTSQELQSNNIMGGNNADILVLDSRWISPLQMGRRIRSLHIGDFNGDSFDGDIRPYVKDMVSQNTNPWLVTADEHWDFDIQMYKDIVVKAPATLSITCKVAMAISGKIIVEKGARLIVDGGLVTGWCKTGLWKGIEVEGTFGYTQLLNNQTGLADDFGVVKVINGGTISNAHNGITNARSDNNGNILWGNQGGIIQCDNANFINNIRDVQFLANDAVDLSKFVKCNFKTNNLLLTGAVPIARVSLWEVHGISFLGCQFEYNAGNAYPIGNRGFGIYSENARYTIDGACNNNTFPCNSFTNSRFLSFDYGVRAENTNPLRTVTVRNSEFYDNTTVSAYFNNMHSFIFENNFIRTPGVNSWAAVYLNNCRNYTVKNNTLLQDGAITQKVFAGIYVNNSESGAHKIYRNSFSNFLVGIAPVGNNSGQQNIDDGLLMNCNDFTQNPNDYDIGLIWSGNPLTAPTVMQTQGVTFGPAMTATNIVRNKYAANCAGNENTWYLQGTNARISDYEHGANSNSFCRPDLFPLCKDVAVTVANSGIGLNFPIHCSSITVPGGCIPPCLEPINLVLGQVIVQTNTLINYYNGVIDGGNTQALLNAINSNISEGDLKNLLLQYSPYLSDAVLSAYFNRTHFPLGHAVQIHDANKPVSSVVWQVIVSRVLSSGIMAQLTEHQNQNPVSDRSGLEQQVSLAKFNLQSISSEKLNYFLTDSLPSSQDSVITLLQYNPGHIPDADILLVFAYINKRNYTAAQTQINSLPTSKSDWKALLNQYLMLQSGPKKEFAIFENTTASSIISNYANSTTGIVGKGSAQSLMKFIKGQDYLIQHPIPVGTSGAKTSQTEIKNAPEENAIISSSEILLYPNPTQNGINIIYKSIEEIPAKIEVTDLLGKVVYINIINNSSNLYVPLNELSSGFYLITISKNKEVIYKSKLLKQD